MKIVSLALLALGLWMPAEVLAKDPAPAAEVSAYDSELARRLGADERGMRKYVMVILKTGPTPVNDPEKRKAMFAGHFANMERLAKEGKLVLAGPFTEDPDHWRGLLVFAVDTVEEAKALTATDPTVANGELVPEFHRWYGSAATMMLTEIDAKLHPPEK